MARPYNYEEIINGFFKTAKAAWSPNCTLKRAVGAHEMNEFTLDAFESWYTTPKMVTNSSVRGKGIAVVDTALTVTAVGPMWGACLKVLDDRDKSRFYPFVVTLAYTDLEGTGVSRVIEVDPHSNDEYPMVYFLGIKYINNKTMPSPANVTNVNVTFAANELTAGLRVDFDPFSINDLNEWKSRSGRISVNVPTRIDSRRRGR